MSRAGIVVFLWVALPAWASIPRAYHVVAERYGVPVEVFYAMLLQESGHTVRGRFHPWPWTLNVDHEARRYDSKQEMAAALVGYLSEGRTIAVGLGQIYLPAHQHVFDDVLYLVHPRVNMEYAALLLATEFQWTVRNHQPDWWLAAGRYHHPSNETFAAPYRRRVFERCLSFSSRCETYGAIPQ